MAIFPANPTRLDPYKNFKFRLKWDGQYVAAVSKVSGLKRTTEVVEHRNQLRQPRPLLESVLSNPPIKSSKLSTISNGD